MPTEPADDNKKVDTVRGFLLNAPPGEFNEVANDVRELIQNDQLLKQNPEIFAQYNKQMYTACKLPGVEEMVLITECNDLGGGRFYDPKSKTAFRYDHLKREASDLEPYEPSGQLRQLEPWRAAIESAIYASVHSRYQQGVVSTFAVSSGAGSRHGSITGSTTPDPLTSNTTNTTTTPNPSAPKIVSCIESHLYQPKNFWNGKWRSRWEIIASNNSDTFQSGSSVELVGTFHIQVHYFEEGNIQLLSTKEVKHTLTISTEEKLAKDVAKLVEDSEDDYQTAINSSYQTMSDSTFKALRRTLPVTKSKIDWAKLTSYKVGTELTKAAPL